MVIERLFPVPPNTIHFVHGYRRKIVDTLIAASILRGNAAHLAGVIPELFGNRHQLSTGLSLLKPYKYVYFNGKIFLDCFHPAFPGKVFDRLAGAMVRNIGRPPGGQEQTISTLIFSITRKCVYRCKHCYAFKTLGKRDTLSRDQLLKIARDFRRLGVGIIAWEGGEPLARFNDLLTLIREMRGETEAILGTTGYGLTREKALQLKEAGLLSAIMSLDHYDPDKHNAFRRNRNAFDMAVSGVRIFRESGILPSIGICITRDTMEDGVLYRYLDLAKDIGAAFVEILDATPSGRYLGREVMLTETQIEKIKRFHMEVNTDARFRDYPAVSARALLEDDSHFGCCAGSTLCYVDSLGNLQACDVLQISFGNVVKEGTDAPYRRMKACFPHNMAGRCPAKLLYKDIAKVYAKSGTLPLRHQDCPHILDKIPSLGPPPRFIRQ